jgi:hypothetical protein
MSTNNKCAMRGVTASLMSMIAFVPLVIACSGCSRSAAQCRSDASTTMCRTSGAPAADADADVDADLAPDDDGVVRPAADASIDASGDEADASAPALLAPIRFHLRNDGSGDVYLGLRFIDRCAFDYTVTKLEANDGGADAGTPSVMIEQPMCPCHPSCTDCSTCALANCYELCDQDPPRIAPGQEYVLTWDGRVFDFVPLCGGTARCAAASPAVPGRYALTVPLFDSAVLPASGAAPARRANTSFALNGASAEGTDIDVSIRLP